MKLDNKNESNLVRSADLVVDSENFRVEKDGQPIALTPRAFDVLTFLLRHQGRVVEKQELFDQVWKESFVSDNALTKVIKEIRRALGDDADAPRYIETVPKRGYRWRAEHNDSLEAETIAIVEEHSLTHIVVEEVQVPDPFEPVPLGTAFTQPRQWSTKKVVVLGAVLVPVLVLVVFSFTRNKEKTPGNFAPLKSLAVLPFKSLKPESGDDYLRVGIADVLITRLSNVSTLAVRPTTSVLKFADYDPLQAGQALKVDSVLDGSIQQVGDRVRVTVRLVRVADGQSLWAYQCDQQCNDVFQLQDLISTKVTEALALKLSGTERERIAQRYTSNQAAWEAYAKGRYYRNRASSEGFGKAVASFPEAIKADPKFALAYAALADAWYWSSATSSDHVPREVMPQAKEEAQKAAALDDELAEAHAALGLLHFTYDWQFPAAEQELKHAVALNPGLPDVQMWYGRYLALMGRFDEAIAVLQHASELDPVSPLSGTEVGLPYFLRGQYDQAIAANVRMLEIDPNLPQVHTNLAISYAMKGEYTKAIAEFECVRQTDAGFALDVGWMLTFTYAKAGDRAAAERTLKENLRVSNGHYVYPYDIAMAYGALGDKDQAFAWLASALRKFTKP